MAIFNLSETNIGGSGGSSWKHLAHSEYEVSTTSTSFVSVGNIDVDYEIYNAAQFIYIRVRDKAGARDGYYAGGDTFVSNILATSYSGGSSRNAPTYISKQSTGWNVNTALSTSSYGIVPYSVNRMTSNFAIDYYRIRMQARYNSTSSKTIDGTYEVDVFALTPPSGYPTVYTGLINGKYIIENIAANGNMATVDKTEAEAGEVVTVTIGNGVRAYDVNIVANIGENGENIIIAESPSEGQIVTFTMPERSVYIFTGNNEGE